MKAYHKAIIDYYSYVINLKLNPFTRLHRGFTNSFMVLQVFRSVPGLKAELGKCGFAAISLEDQALQMYDSLVACSMKEWPITYLGLPLGGNPWAISF